MLTATTTELRRELGRWDMGRPGPTLLVLAGVHGNEPAGVAAVQRVLDTLQQRELAVRGRLVAFAGNLRALAEGRRFVDRDLNRGWSRGAVQELAARRRAAGAAEDTEQRELLAGFEQVLHSAAGPVVFVDLHSSSADGPPFLCLADTIDNRRLGLATGVPMILGIEETIDGASLEWFADRGIAGLAVEGGRHGHPETIANHEAVLWSLLVRLGIVDGRDVDLAPHRARLAQAGRGAPPIVEIVARHAITAADGFRMQPGFVNFAAVAKGALLATDRRGQILAPSTCHVMLPLYQAQGDDGFFLAKPVRPFWSWLAGVMRRLRGDVLLRFLPGVRRDPADANTLLVDRRVARWYATEVFHLLGFRRERERGGQLAFSRRWSRPENRRL